MTTGLNIWSRFLTVYGAPLQECCAMDSWRAHRTPYPPWQNTISKSLNERLESVFGPWNQVYTDTFSVKK